MSFECLFRCYSMTPDGACWVVFPAICHSHHGKASDTNGVHDPQKLRHGLALRLFLILLHLLQIYRTHESA